jgi:hypothetical protein
MSVEAVGTMLESSDSENILQRNNHKESISKKENPKFVQRIGI